MGIYNTNGDLLIEDKSIMPSYYQSEMADTLEKVRVLQNEPNLTFCIITDIHAYADLRSDYIAGTKELYKTSAANMMEFLKNAPCDGVINLGDNIEGYTTSKDAHTQGNKVSTKFREIDVPYYSVIGNHDDNRYHMQSNNERLSVGERYQLFVNPTRNVVTDSTGLNYYVDFDEFGIRMICLNSVSEYSYKYDTDTCAWFSDTAITGLPTGYKVLILTHVAPVGTWNYNGVTPTNSAIVQTALSGTDLMAIICGHNHVDAVFDTPFNGITLSCAKFENENGDPAKWTPGSVKPQRTLKTATEDCWTVCVIRPYAQKINFIRFGAGDDYEIDYGSANT